MAAGFLNKLLGRSQTQPKEIEQALAQLEKLQAERPALSAPTRLLGEILPLLWGACCVELNVPWTREDVIARLSAGIPLLRDRELAVDPRSFARRWQAIARAVRQQQGEKIAFRPIDAQRWLQELLAGRPATVHEEAEALGMEPKQAATLFRLCVFPDLSHLQSAAAPLRAGIQWERGYCLFCGSWPLLGEFRGLEQTRFLRCGLCAAEWEYPRLRCSFCEERDHEKLGYFHVEGEESRQRVATCEACRGYVKMVNTLFGLSGPLLLVTDAATLHLDLAAAERGFGVPS